LKAGDLVLTLGSMRLAEVIEVDDRLGEYGIEWATGERARFKPCHLVAIEEQSEHVEEPT